MSVKRNLADDKHSIANNLMDITKYLTINANESISTSYDTVAALVTEMVEVTSNRCTEESPSGSAVTKCQISTEVKGKTTEASNLANVEDLPVRRSSRIQLLNIHIDVKKKGNRKESKQNKNTKISAEVEKEPLLVVDKSTEKDLQTKGNLKSSKPNKTGKNFSVENEPSTVIKEPVENVVKKKNNHKEIKQQKNDDVSSGEKEPLSNAEKPVTTDVKKMTYEKEIIQHQKKVSLCQKESLPVSNGPMEKDVKKKSPPKESKQMISSTDSPVEKESLPINDEPVEKDVKNKSIPKESKQAISTIDSPVEKESLPVNDEPVEKDVKKKNYLKESKQVISTISSPVEKDSLLVNEEPTINNAKNTLGMQNESDSNCSKEKEEALKTRPTRRVQKKDEKEPLKVNETKKRAYKRKKKLSLLELDKSIDQVICDVIKSSVVVADATVDTKTDIVSLTSNVEKDSSLHNEAQKSESVQDNDKADDSESLDSKDKEVEDNNLKPVKVKSRWWRSSELEGVLSSETNSIQEFTNSVSECPEEMMSSPVVTELAAEKMEIDIEPHEIKENCDTEPIEGSDVKTAKEGPVYEHIDDNIYRFTKKKSKSKKQVRRMVCDCTLTKEEQECGVLGCKEECLNRLLMIECGYRCPLGEACSNKRFQKKQYMKSEIFKAFEKGWGLRALEDVSRDDFLIEFVGEIVNHKEYRQRVKQYAKEKVLHSYFMAFKTDEILDATIKGNTSRFINHSCDPNCETQKWTVNGELRVGVFAKRTIRAGEEFTLDYKFQRYGREAQKCLCGSHNCSGYIGGGKQISIDAYGISKSGSNKKKKGSDDKKRDLDDIALEEEIEKLNSSKGLRNKEETLKLARLMVRAEDSVPRHQLLDIIIKTEEQACLRLFLDYHGLPLMWSWMTDIVDLDLKAKILQVLNLLPISNKTMLLDSKVMSVVEKWVQECSNKGYEQPTNDKAHDSSLTSPADDTSEPAPKKLKNIEFSDSETDSTGSHNANDNSSETSSITDNFKADIISSGDVLAAGENIDSSKENKLSDTTSKIKQESLDDPNIQIKTNICNIGEELLCNWKNLKEVFRIPRLEQQKRKEDEMEADLSVLMKTEKKAEVEVTGDHIQVLVSTFTPRFSDDRIYENDNPEVDFKASEQLSNNNLLPILTTISKRFSKPSSNKEAQRIVKEEPKSMLETELPNRPSLLPTPAYLSQSPVTFPPPLNPGVAPPALMKQPPPQAMYPLPQIVYPQPQVPFVNTAALPPTLSHPPSSMAPPAQILPQPSPSLLQPPPSTSYPPPNTNLPLPNTNLPPPGTNLPPPTSNLPPPSTNHPPPSTNLSLPHTNLPPPVNTILPSNPVGFRLPPTSVVPPNMPPPSGHFIQNQPPTGFPPPVQNPYGNQNQPFYYVQQQPPPTMPGSSAQTTYNDNVCVQTSASLPLPVVDTFSNQNVTYPSSNSLPIQPINSIPMQTTASLPHQQMQPTTSLPIQMSTLQPVPQPVAPVIKEEARPVKLPKNWRSATDDEGNVYYYHSVTRVTQWDPPTGDQIEEDDDSEEEEEDSESEESESSDTPTYDEPKISTKHSKRKSKKRKTTKAAADTSVSFPVRPEIAKKIKELFRTKMSSYIVHCLNGYRKPDCKVGRITNNDDFKYLARKLTHYTMTKELKQCKNVEDLDCNEQVMHKAKDFIKKYMAKYGSKFSRKEKFSPET